MNNAKILMIYTGGTIGMLPKDKTNPQSPLVPKEWDELSEYVPALKRLPILPVLKPMSLIDSSDMTPAYWIDIAAVIRDHYEAYDGFVILHGTDTMTYTASALSFLLENLSKPVILTGAQLPIYEPRNDALQNLVTSLMIAASNAFNLPIVPEVCIFFNNALLRGNRSKKISSSAYKGFESPNYPALGEVGEHIRIHPNLIRKPSSKPFFIHDHLETRVLMFDIFPGMTPKILDQLFHIEDLKGVVLRTYGTGNMPTDSEFIKPIESALSRGLCVVNVTQCMQGAVEPGLYDAGTGLMKLGVISGSDMTSEAALVKMMFVLGQDCTPAEIKARMEQDLRGEMTDRIV